MVFIPPRPKFLPKDKREVVRNATAEKLGELLISKKGGLVNKAVAQALGALVVSAKWNAERSHDLELRIAQLESQMRSEGK